MQKSYFLNKYGEVGPDKNIQNISYLSYQNPTNQFKKPPIYVNNNP
jgi:hypothetical protein